MMKKSEEEKKYLKDLRKLRWYDSDADFYKWVEVEAKHECSPKQEFMKDFYKIWTTGDDFHLMDMDVWEKQRELYKNLCAYGKYF